MTAYVVSVSTTASFNPGSSPAASITWALSPVTYPIRIIQIEYTLTNVQSTYYSIVPSMRYSPTIYRYPSGSASGGSSVSPVALRQGSATPSTTARWGTGVSVSGTQIYVASPTPINTPRYSDVGQTYTFPADFTVAPGGVITFVTGSIGGKGAGSGETNSGRVQAIFFFEEYLLSWQ